MTTINVPLDLQKMAIDFVSLMHAELFKLVFFLGGWYFKVYPRPCPSLQKTEIK